MTVFFGFLGNGDSGDRIEEEGERGRVEGWLMLGESHSVWSDEGETGSKGSKGFAWLCGAGTRLCCAPKGNRTGKIAANGAEEALLTGDGDRSMPSGFVVVRTVMTRSPRLWKASSGFCFCVRIPLCARSNASSRGSLKSRGREEGARMGWQERCGFEGLRCGGCAGPEGSVRGPLLPQSP